MTDEDEKQEDTKKRDLLEKLSDEIQQVNETKVASEAAAEPLDNPIASSSPLENILGAPAPKIGKQPVKGNPIGQEERERENCESKDASMEITGNEDIDENMFFTTQQLS